jgi:hypothetical protein
VAAWHMRVAEVFSGKLSTIRAALLTLLFGPGPLKQHAGGRCFHSNENVEMAVRKWLRVQEPDFDIDGYFNLPRCGQIHGCARGLCGKIMILE